MIVGILALIFAALLFFGFIAFVTWVMPRIRGY